MGKEQTVGLIGTGVMGSGMAANLLRAGYPVLVYNRTPEKTLPLTKQGAVLCRTVAELAAGADVVITMVGYPKDVEELYFGKGGILEAVRPGSYVVDMTTSRPALAERIYRAAKERGVFALDAPVSGGDIGARDGTLSVMVGGEPEVFEAVRPVFEAMGSKIILEGGPGAGQHTKMCNQIAIAATIMGVCELLTYAKHAGLDPQKVLDGVSTGAAGSWQLSAYAPRILKGDYQPGFFVRHFIKDMGIALDEAGSMGIDLPALKLSKSLYDRLAQEGRDALGTQALYQLYEEENGKGSP